MAHWVNTVQTHRLFRILSSVRLALPLLLLLAVIIAVGTLYESRYNAEYANLKVYGTPWFEATLALLGLNIFFATLSRWPWKRRHTGFLITHFGMLTLLAGAGVTKYFGIDGQMYVREGGQSDEVALDRRVLEISGGHLDKKVFIHRSTQAQNEDDFAKTNTQLAPTFKILEYRPFVELTDTDHEVFSTGTTVQARIKSAFFDQTIALNSASQNELQMGPVLFRLVTDEKTLSPHKNSPATRQKPTLLIKSKSTQKTLKEIPLADLEKAPLVIKGVKINLKKRFTHATVVQNKISDGGEKFNPALEIEMEKGSERVRDFVFSRFPDFSLASESGIDLQLVYLLPDEQKEGPHTPTPHPSSTISGHVMEFHVGGPQTRLKLIKNSQEIFEQDIKVHETLITPWMKMEVTLLELLEQGETSSVQTYEPRMVEPTPKTDPLPPSALRLSTGFADKDFWLIEGQVRTLPLKGENGDENSVQIYYGRNMIRLPFALHLQKFSKQDYPGTETAMSFESQVLVNGVSPEQKISMNEPLKKEGYTLYQASYDMTEGRPVASIFSVNRDPGRPIKYAGCFIMSLGIIVYTLSKSRRRQKGQK